MLFGVPGLTRILIAAAILVSASVAIVSCGGGSSAKNQHTVSGLAYRVFVSNPLFPSGTGYVPVMNIVDATQDVLSTSFISLLTASPQAGLMALSPDLKYTMVFSPSGNLIALIDNTTEALATNGTASVPTITIPGNTGSMFIGADNATGYAAVPTAPVIGQSPGAVVAMSLLNGAVTATIPVSGAQFIVPSPDGDYILVFGDSPNSVTIIATALVGTSEDPRSTVCCFDHPVWGVFKSDSRTAYIFDCGPEQACGGSGAGITLLTVGSSTAGKTTPVSAATYGMLNGSTLYVAGTPPNTPCGSGTAAKTCGTLNIINTSSMTLMNSSPIIITDGYHDRMQISQDGQLFIGAYDCSNVNSSVEVRGCLSIFNTNNSSVVIPPENGDVTAIQPIAGREVVYVIQNGSLNIYDTATDKLQVTDNNGLNNYGQVDIVGQLVDMKLVDPPQ